MVWGKSIVVADVMLIGILNCKKNLSKQNVEIRCVMLTHSKYPFQAKYLSVGCRRLDDCLKQEYTCNVRNLAVNKHEMDIVYSKAVSIAF